MGRLSVACVLLILSLSIFLIKAQENVDVETELEIELPSRKQGVPPQPFENTTQNLTANHTVQSKNVSVAPISNEFGTVEPISDVPVPQTPPPYCALPSEPGPCEAEFVRWFHNPENARCEEFTFGGCSGNANNFESLENCMAVCVGKFAPTTSVSTTLVTTAGPICDEPAVTGNCRAAITRWFFNNTSLKCQTFMYGGCGSNGNNFQTQQQCIESCHADDATTHSTSEHAATHTVNDPTSYNYDKEKYKGGYAIKGNMLGLIAICCILFH